jgi:hypothetical protein
LEYPVSELVFCEIQEKYAGGDGQEQKRQDSSYAPDIEFRGFNKQIAVDPGDRSGRDQVTGYHEKDCNPEVPVTKYAVYVTPVMAVAAARKH